MNKNQIKLLSQRFNTPLVYLVFGLISTLVVFLIWLPFGFTLIGLIEEWGALGLFTNNGLFFIVDLNTPLPLTVHATRPLTLFPHALAYYLDPNSFYYWHILLILTLVVKGSAASQLIWKATNSLGWALVMGTLLILYPADTMQLSFRSLHINFALALFLLSSSVFIVAYEKHNRLSAYVLASIAAALAFAAICMYEAALLLTPLPFLICFVRDGFKQCWQQLRSKLGLSALWLMAPISYVGYYVWVARNLLKLNGIVSYQEILVGDKIAAVLTQNLPDLFKIGVLRGVLGGWFDAIRIVMNEYIGYSYLFMAVLFITTFIFLGQRTKRDNLTTIKYSVSMRLAFVGLLLLMLGFAPFLLSHAHLHITQRTYLFASLGAAIMWIACLICIARLSKWLASFATVVLIFFGLGAQLFQFHHYIQIGEKQRNTLKSIIENIEINDQNKTIIINDGSNLLGSTWMLHIEELPRTLAYLYGHAIKTVEVCRMPSHEWQRPDTLGRSGLCIERKNDWLLQAAEPVSGPGVAHPVPPKNVKLAKNNVISIPLNAKGLVSTHSDHDAYLNKLRTDNTPVAQRYRAILTQKPWPLHLISFRDQVISDHYKWSFGKWWNLDLPVRGSGWRAVEWTVNKFHHQSAAWKSQGNSSLYFEFLPAEKHYILQGEFIYFVSDRIHESTYVRINQINIPLHWVSNTKFEATIPDGVMLSGLNRIDFNSKIDPTYYGLSSMLAWFEVANK